VIFIVSSLSFAADHSSDRGCGVPTAGFRPMPGRLEFGRDLAQGPLAPVDRIAGQPLRAGAARALLGADPPAADPQPQSDVAPDAPPVLPCLCPRCGARMIVIEVFARGCEPSWRPTPTASDTS